MKASNIIQASMALAFQAQTSMTAAVTTSVAANALLVGGCAGVAPEYQLQCYKDQCPQPTNGPLGSSCASYPPANQLECYKSKCPELATRVTTSQPVTQQTSPPLIGGCHGVAPQYQLQCYKENCHEPAGPPGSSCASYPPDYQLACYKSKCDPKPETTTTVEIALQSPVGASAGSDCAGVAPEYELECFYHNCPMPGPPGFSCASLPPQYQIDCYKKRCHEVYTPLASEPALQTPNSVPETPSPAQQTPNAAQQSPGLDRGCINVAPENQLECYRNNCLMSGPIGYSCGTLPLDYQLQCYKAHCDGHNSLGAELPVLQTLEGACATSAPENQEECFQKECFKLFCASLPVQNQLQCYRQHCSVPDISELINGFGNTLGGIVDDSSASGISDDDGSSASGSSDDDGANGQDSKGKSFPDV
ncbi:hypothetical protein BELL_0265g00120 [Botrytis elliptica]|uniref:Uncharacterized protein n=1 Tax=Botrytis elliptica TaxID=278938 RepID=A0A4Z1JLW2_9HELO|nr:hypothetical protein EAE99_010577 [Botrytis elliptica]TGO74655.1 hypothetical protein BELL_0265g00120 [Botrytis elliptica]